MTDEMVKHIFGPKVRGGLLIVSDGIYVTVEDFARLFSASDGSYESLMAIDDGRLGYAAFFDRCRKEGILS